MTIRVAQILLIGLAVCGWAMLSGHPAFGHRPGMEVLPGMVMPEESDLLNVGCVRIKSYSIDKFPQVAGPETTVVLYRCPDRQCAIYRFENLETYAVALRNRQGCIEACIDEDSLGHCTRVVQEDEEFSIDFGAYGIATTPFTAYGSDVLKSPQPEGLTIPKRPTNFSGEPQ